MDQVLAEALIDGTGCWSPSSARAQGHTVPHTQQKPLALEWVNREVVPCAAVRRGARPAVAGESEAAGAESLFNCTLLSNHIQSRSGRGFAATEPISSHRISVRRAVALRHRGIGQGARSGSPFARGMIRVTSGRYMRRTQAKHA